MRFTVLSRKETERALKGGAVFDGIISINDVNQRMPWEVKNKHKGSYMQLYFHDIDRDVGFGYTAPHPTDVEKIIEYARRVQKVKPDAHIMSHCVAGISRSSAAVLIAAAATGHDVGDTLHSILAVRPQIWPNALMIKFAEDQLGIEMADTIYEDIGQLVLDNYNGKRVVLEWGEHVYGKKEQTEEGTQGDN